MMNMNLLSVVTPPFIYQFTSPIYHFTQPLSLKCISCNHYVHTVSEIQLNNSVNRQFLLILPEFYSILGKYYTPVLTQIICGDICGAL